MVTMKDIAREAGVSQPTVSVVLNNRATTVRIGEKTRRKILDTAKRMGYRRNELATTIRTGTNRTVAIICNFEKMETSSPYNLTMSGIVREATNIDYGIKIFSDNDLSKCVDKIIGNQIQFVLSLSVEQEKRRDLSELCRQHKLKLVYLYEKAQDEFPAVASDDRNSACNVVRHLAKLGHRRIALICSTHQFNYAIERHKGYSDGLAAEGIKEDPRLTICGETLLQRMHGIRRMLNLPANSRPTAFLCVGDPLAMLVEREAFKRGLKIPEDISVVGFGNYDICRFAVVPICSIAQPFAKMGSVALKVLLGKKCDCKPDPYGNYLVPNQFVRRVSAGFNINGASS